MRNVSVSLSSIELQSTMPVAYRERRVACMRRGGLAAIHRKLSRARDGVDTRMYLAKEDDPCLRGLRQHGSELAISIHQDETE